MSFIKRKRYGFSKFFHISAIFTPINRPFRTTYNGFLRLPRRSKRRRRTLISRGVELDGHYPCEGMASTWQTSMPHAVSRSGHKRRADIPVQSLLYMGCRIQRLLAIKKVVRLETSSLTTFFIESNDFLSRIVRVFSDGVKGLGVRRTCRCRLATCRRARRGTRGG